jgi:hypothetical protein
MRKPKPMVFPGVIAPADACLTHLSLNGAKQFCAQLMTMFPNVHARFMESFDRRTMWLELSTKSDNESAHFSFSIPANRKDSMHRALILADLVAHRYSMMARDFESECWGAP